MYVALVAPAIFVHIAPSGEDCHWYCSPLEVDAPVSDNTDEYSEQPEVTEAAVMPAVGVPEHTSVADNAIIVV